MTRPKYNKLHKISDSLQNLTSPLIGKPALSCALVLMAVYACFDTPIYGFILLLSLVLLIRFFPKNVQWMIFFTLLAGFACHTFNAKIEDANNRTPDSKACGMIESLMPRSNGMAYVIKINPKNQAEGKTQNPYHVRITEKRELNVFPEPGDSICYEASWYPVTPPTVPGGFDTRNWLKSQGFLAYGKFIHWDSWKGAWIPERSFYNFRMWIKSRFDDYLEPAETGLLLGLLAGDRSGIPDALRSDFQRSGLVHVLAISGFHVVLLAGMLMIFLKATRLPHKVVRIIAVILLFIYIPVTGSSPAVKRAVLMFSVPQIGALLQRPANTLNSLGVALIFILIQDPSQLWNPGFQLSVAATAGILIGGSHNPLKHLPESLKKNFLWSKIQEFFIDPTYVTLCATFATAPFLIHHFKTLSPLAWLGNIIVVPAISWGMQAGLFALISPFDFLRQHFCYAAGFFLRLASYLTRMLSDSSEASITVGPFGPAILLILGLLFLILPICRKNLIARTFCFSSLLLFAFLFCYGAFEKAGHPKWTLTAIDVGQGDSILITTPSGKHLLIDTGPNDRVDSGEDIIVPYLHHIGVLQLDALIITHPDADHFGGAQSLFRTFPVKELWISECAQREQKIDWQNTLDDAIERNIFIRNIHRGFSWKENLFEIFALHPRQDHCGETNEESITLRVKSLGHSAILTGDLTVAGEKEILRTDSYLKSDILKLGHHGSKTSSSPQFLTAIKPRLAFISSGRHNRFRHPHKAVIQRLDSLRIPYLNTARNGTISFTFTTDTMIVKTMLE